MAEMTLTRMRLAGGVWEGLLSGRDEPPALRIRHRDQLVAEAETEPSSDGWFVRFRLPLDRLSDGIQTFVIVDAIGRALEARGWVAVRVAEAA